MAGVLEAGEPSSLFPSNIDDGEESPEFVKNLPVRFLCVCCKQPLRNPHQLGCGHTACKTCISTYIGDRDKVRCPTGEDDCEETKHNELFPDSSRRREMKQLEVFCQNRQDGCEQRMKWKLLRDHLKTCPFARVECGHPGCDQTPRRRSFERHSDDCPYRHIRCHYCGEIVIQQCLQEHIDRLCQEVLDDCPFPECTQQFARKFMVSHKEACKFRQKECKYKHVGCQFRGSIEQVEHHNTNEYLSHMDILASKVTELSLECLTLRNEVQEKNDELQSSHRATEKNRQLTDELFDTRQHQGEMIEQLNQKLAEAKTESENSKRQIMETHQMIREMKTQLERLQHDQRQTLQSVQSSVERQETRISVMESDGGAQHSSGGSGQLNTTGTLQSLARIDRDLMIQNTRLAEMDLRFQCVETTSYNGTCIWKISDYRRRKQEAVSGSVLSLYSQPYHTSRHGYKMCGRIYLNGDGIGRGSHISVFFVLMKGDYDALLRWPFAQKVSLCLLPQQVTTNARPITDNFVPDPTSSSFQQPQREMNVASGCPLFARHDVMETQTFLKDDCIFVKMVVDISNLPYI